MLGLLFLSHFFCFVLFCFFLEKLSNCRFILFSLLFDLLLLSFSDSPNSLLLFPMLEVLGWSLPSPKKPPKIC